MTKNNRKKKSHVDCISQVVPNCLSSPPSLASLRLAACRSWFSSFEFAAKHFPIRGAFGGECVLLPGSSNLNC